MALAGEGLVEEQPDPEAEIDRLKAELESVRREYNDYMAQIMGPVHGWPKNDYHVWNNWQAFSRIKQYRTCVHPACHEVEYRDVPKEQRG